MNWAWTFNTNGARWGRRWLPGGAWASAPLRPMGISPFSPNLFPLCLFSCTASASSAIWLDSPESNNGPTKSRFESAIGQIGRTDARTHARTPPSGEHRPMPPRRASLRPRSQLQGQTRDEAGGGRRARIAIEAVRGCKDGEAERLSHND